MFRYIYVFLCLPDFFVSSFLPGCLGDCAWSFNGDLEGLILCQGQQCHRTQRAPAEKTSPGFSAVFSCSVASLSGSFLSDFFGPLPGVRQLAGGRCVSVTLIFKVLEEQFRCWNLGAERWWSHHDIAAAANFFWVAQNTASTCCNILLIVTCLFQELVVAYEVWPVGLSDKCAFELLVKFDFAT